MDKLTLTNILTILAIIFGPIIAVQLTRYLDDAKEKRQRKLDIFHTLMATRAYITSWDHVVALNKIDLEFNKGNKKEKAIIEAWHSYFDVLGDNELLTRSADQWNDRRISSLVELLHKMALVLNYDFDKTHIKNSSYAPVAHSDLESEQAAIRQGLIDVLNGVRPIPIKTFNSTTEPTQ